MLIIAICFAILIPRPTFAESHIPRPPPAYDHVYTYDGDIDPVLFLSWDVFRIDKEDGLYYVLLENPDKFQNFYLLNML